LDGSRGKFGLNISPLFVAKQLRFFFAPPEEFEAHFPRVSLPTWNGVDEKALFNKGRLYEHTRSSSPVALDLDFPGVSNFPRGNWARGVSGQTISNVFF